ncbi:MAG: AAA family ATPase [Phycisphaerales bacterium]
MPDPKDASAQPSPDELRQRIERFRADADAVETQIRRVVVGQAPIVQGVLTSLFCGGNILLEGLPGLGKTLLIRTLADALTLDFTRIQFTPDLMPADITGTTIVRDTPQGREFVFEPGPVFTQILLADEINRATPKTQSALLEAMQEKSVTAGGATRPLPKPFFVMATQNPIEQEGVYPLPEAQLDRFLFKLNVGYSNREELSEILRRTTRGESANADAVIDADRILAYQALVRSTPIADHVQDYAVRLVLSTHPGGEFATPMVNRFVRIGASPRAAQAIVLGAKCRALRDGRVSVAVEDLIAIAPDALRHRVMLNFEGDAEGLTPDAVIDNCVSTLPVEAGAAG